jgi:hypothetical protein
MQVTGEGPDKDLSQKELTKAERREERGGHRKIRRKGES